MWCKTKIIRAQLEECLEGNTQSPTPMGVFCQLQHAPGFEHNRLSEFLRGQ